MKRTPILWAFVPVFTALYQLCIKLAVAQVAGMDFGPAWLARAFVGPWMWAAIGSEAAAFIIWMQILASHDLSKAFPLSAVSYVLILGMSRALFHEAILPLQWLGGALILAGVYLISTAKNTEKP